MVVQHTHMASHFLHTLLNPRGPKIGSATASQEQLAARHSDWALITDRRIAAMAYRTADTATGVFVESLDEDDRC